jgi:hypothetical protein
MQALRSAGAVVDTAVAVDKAVPQLRLEVEPEQWAVAE